MSRLVADNSSNAQCQFFATRKAFIDFFVLNQYWLSGKRGFLGDSWNSLGDSLRVSLRDSWGILEGDSLRILGGILGRILGEIFFGDFFGGFFGGFLGGLLGVFLGASRRNSCGDSWKDS